MIDFHQLRQLVTIAELGSLSAAAEKLHISQPALSRSMQRLEADLGLSLFEHRQNRIVFRELGLRAVERANSLLLDANRYVDDLRAYARQLSILLIGSSSPTLMWRLSTEIHERFPDLVVTEELSAAEELQEGLCSGHYRLILSHLPMKEHGILCREYMEERLLLELPPTHPLSSRQTLELKDLANTPILSYRRVGVWRERLGELANLHLIEQTDLDVLEDLALASGLPVLSFSTAPTPTAGLGGRVSLPILGEGTGIPFFLCARKEDQDLFDRLC